MLFPDKEQVARKFLRLGKGHLPLSSSSTPHSLSPGSFDASAPAGAGTGSRNDKKNVKVKAKKIAKLAHSASSVVV